MLDTVETMAEICVIESDNCTSQYKSAEHFEDIQEICNNIKSPRTKSPPDKIPSKYSSRQNPLGHKPLGDKISSRQNPLAKKLFQKTYLDKNPSDTSHSRQNPL